MTNTGLCLDYLRKSSPLVILIPLKPSLYNILFSQQLCTEYKFSLNAAYSYTGFDLDFFFFRDVNIYFSSHCFFQAVYSNSQCLQCLFHTKLFSVLYRKHYRCDTNRLMAVLVSSSVSCKSRLKPWFNAVNAHYQPGPMSRSSNHCPIPLLFYVPMSVF